MTSPGSTNARLAMHSTITSQVGPEFAMAANVSPPQNFAVHASAHGAANCSESSSESRSPELPLVKASDRESRIIAEKHRRSQYKAEIECIYSLLSDIIPTQRKLDKTSILRLAADKLRNEHVFGNTVKCDHLETWSPAILKCFDLFGGFMIAVTCRGRIFIVSPNIQEKLGYCHIDLLGQDIYKYIHNEDKDILRFHIYPPELQSGFDDNLLKQQHNFKIRFLRAGAKSDLPRYEQCHINGTHRRSDKATANGIQDKQIIRRQRVRHNRTFTSSGNDFVFIGMVHVLSNVRPVCLVSPTAYSEYKTRHLIDGRIVECDQSISLAAGYMTEEVTGTSAFIFMHKDDVRWVICVLRQMYDQSREYGESYYRLITRSGHFIYMRTRGFLEIDPNTKKVQSFVCINRVISQEYGRKMMEEMKRKYSVIVDMENQSERVSCVDEAPVEHPKHLERIVMHLVEPPASENIDELKLVPPSKENIISAIKNSEKVVQETGIRFDTRKRKKSDHDDEEVLKRHSLV
ncbi:PREDICTED: circadian locomoter output cycles protein kaput-like [Papilio polytes]|uniref:circadian locomoter output cycles protein kaput-like n=1 Tax=Papilio polytes TaxID=76194 RepID=UPI0006760EC7|nr:PREDICTED: circadian locomoter output cycles protein kaput-like [Papilio polytes]